MSRSPIFREAQVRLRDFIRAEGLKPGDRLPPEATLAAQLGVSRVSLREATRSLQTLGVIEARHGNGLYVSEFSFRPVVEQLPYGLASPGLALEEVLTAREAIEVGLMPAVARQPVEADLAACGDLARRMSDLEAAGESIVDVDRRFHLQLYTGLGNALVDNLIELFWGLFVKLGDALPAPVQGGRGDRHLAIVEALQSGDELAAIQAMRAHFDDVRSRAATLRTG